MGSQAVTRIGVVGTGFVSSHFVMGLDRHPGYAVSRVLTRRPAAACLDYPRPDCLVSSLGEMLEHSDVVVECSGDPLHAADVIAAALTAGVPVVTLNAGFHITAGSWFVGKGLLSEAEGDQPGCLAALHEEALILGFEPMVYGTIKTHLDHDPIPAAMQLWSHSNGISLPLATAFTDGTKVQIEQALIANGLGAGIGANGLIGPAEDDLQAGANRLAAAAEALGMPIADYVLSGSLPQGVFLVGRHDARQQPALRYLRLGGGPYYVLLRHNIFVHLEILKTIERLLRDKQVLLDNSDTPTISVAAVAKRDLQPGERVPRGIGSFDARGEAVRIADFPGHLPIGLLQGAVMRRSLKRGDIFGLDDVELPESLALRAWLDIEARALGTGNARAAARNR